MKNTWKKWMAVTCAMMMTICPLAVTAASAEENTVVTVEAQETNPSLKLATPTDLQAVAVPEETVEEPAAEIAEETVEQPVERPVEELTEETANENADEAAQEEIVESAEETAEEEILIQEYETPLGMTQNQVITLSGIGDKEINVRENADGLSPIMASLTEGTEITVVEMNDGWATVIVNGEIGYIFLKDLKGMVDAPATEENEESAQKQKKVTIFSSRRRIMEVGEPVYLTSELEGFEDCTEIVYIWKVDKGNGFEIVPDANEATYSFPATAETLSWTWHLTVMSR